MLVKMLLLLIWTYFLGGYIYFLYFFSAKVKIKVKEVKEVK